MRIASIFAAGTLACALALAAGRSESITYVDGNLTGITPHSGGTLLYSGEQALELKTGLATVAVPFEGISKAQLSAPQEHSNAEPIYKVWALHKRFSKTETQLLTVDFKNGEGEAKTMTVEMGSSAAANVLSAIKKHNQNLETNTLAKADPPVEPSLKPARTKADRKKDAAPAEAPPAAATSASKDEGWWGDKVWKTSRNADKWGKESANAPE